MYPEPLYSSRIPVTLVKDHAYCPAIPWIRRFLGYREPRSPSMETARVDASYKEEVARELGLPRPWRIELPVQGVSIPLSGVVDIVAGDKRLTVVEVKAYKRRMDRSRHFRIQLLLYAYIVNETIGPVREAILYMQGHVYRTRVTLDLLEEARREAEKTLKTLASEEPPRPRQPRRKCSYCWYRRVCPSHY
ncbi:MAG: CRISPR-associated protein Cas4 [Desulfurococcales archaeon]|nr:CRISPR-associated protein Cas4 [Desulfurococcales archaeon]